MRKEMVTFRTPKSPVSEMFKTLRTNIQFMNTKGGLKTLLFTSTMPGEGKSWISANLAVTFAQAGKRVILVDADMRKGRQFAMFGVKPTPGLSNYLSGYGANGEELSDDILQYIRETEVENLFLIPSGSIPPNPSELLVSERTVEMIKKLESMCDLIIFDGTPSLMVTDAVILSRLVDSTIIVSSHKETKMDNLETVKENIVNVGGKIGGVVLNKIPVSQKKYESEYYYYGNKNALVPIDAKSKKNKKAKKAAKQHYEPVMIASQVEKKLQENKQEEKLENQVEDISKLTNNMIEPMQEHTKMLEKKQEGITVPEAEAQSVAKVEIKHNDMKMPEIKLADTNTLGINQENVNGLEVNQSSVLGTEAIDAARKTEEMPVQQMHKQVEERINENYNYSAIKENIVEQNENNQNNIVEQNKVEKNKIEQNTNYQNNYVEREEKAKERLEQNETAKMIAQLNAYLEREKAKLNKGDGR